MLCKGCGAEVTSDQLYCSHCGTKNEATNVISNQQMPPNNTVQQVQMSNYSSMPNQMPPHSMGPGMVPPLPPMPPSSMYGVGAGKKNNVIVPIIIGIVALIFMIVGIIGIIRVVGFLKVVSSNQEEMIDTYVDDSSDDPSTEDTTGSNNEDAVTDDALEGSYGMAYSYEELPDLMSIDSDHRFFYYDKSGGEDFVTYMFLYSNGEATEEDFYTAVINYCDLLTSLNGFYYEEEFSTNQYNETGTSTDYYSKDNTAIGVTASAEDSGWFAYIDIYDLTDSVESTVGDSTLEDSIIDDNTDIGVVEGSSDQSENYNYSYYIEGRESQYFDLNTEVVMENGIAFYLYDATVTDLGDGTAQIDCTMDLAALNPDTYLYTDDFLLMPMDSEGYSIGDASLVEYVADIKGEYMTAPYLLDTEYYDTYTLSFIVPVEATTFSVYGSNVSEGYAAGPVYCIDLEVTQ